MPLTIGVAHLQTAYNEVVNGSIDSFIQQFRENPTVKYNVSRASVKAMFKAMELWKKIKQSSGHLTYKHAITGIVVGCQGHSSSNKKMSDLPPDQAQNLCDNLQCHINILGNDIFGYTTQNWKTVPDFGVALRNYTAWKSS